MNMLLPGRIETSRVRRLDAVRAARSGRSCEETAAESVADIPARRYGTPVEFGSVAAFLCGGPAAYLTGMAVRCDGGLSPVL